MTTQPDQPDVRQVLVHPAVWPHLEAWLAIRGIELARIPVGDDDLPTYAMTPTDAAMAAAARPDDGARPVAVPDATFRRLVTIAQHASLGRTAAGVLEPHPDATARRALGELIDAGLLPATTRPDDTTGARS